ncbi:UDP-2,4-diacetamido-2,4,6-trideoxy-beta-L-altropyranose hydrolase [Ideonella sp. YS5]|uniref:UDP-2,4-diacetamido-2,4, 6-trideoxy-beta-L-altropyranose hydrolase n=1 Tax=Ideonella sp. YS5 TaxID=3453714 RepID=UPI003EEDFA3D
MKVAFRVDASERIGSGHLVRCATLADALRQRGAEVLFLCRALPPAWGEWLASQGWPWADLGPASKTCSAEAGDPGHAHWLGTDWQTDAAETARVLGDERWDALVVDHYALDARWERRLRANALRLLAIDDLADRTHDVDLLLDPNLYDDMAHRYVGLVPPGTRQLLGPRFALLRPEFAAARQAMAPRGDEVKRVLVFFGGFDARNATGRVLEALDELRRSGIAPFAVDAVIGALHPAREALSAFCRGREGWTCHVQTDRMAELMARADVAVGAGGGATWERCALGLPTLAVAQADNQVEQVATAARAGLLCAPQLRDEASVAAWRIPIEALWFDPVRRARVGSAGVALVDGLGARRVAQHLCRPALTVRRATAADSAFVHSGRNAESVRRVSRSTTPIAWVDHQRWYDSVLADRRRELLVGCLGEEPVGVLRYDLDADGRRAEVSLYLAPGREGHGLGPELLCAAEAWLRRERPEVRTLVAEVLSGNRASIHLFEQDGYAACSQHFEKGLNP